MYGDKTSWCLEVADVSIDNHRMLYEWLCNDVVVPEEDPIPEPEDPITEPDIDEEPAIVEEPSFNAGGYDLNPVN